MRMALRVADLFCGMGGFGLGFRHAGFAVTGYDIDVQACRTYKMNGVGDAVSCDLTQEEPSGTYDAVVGGPPCEPWSCLNIRRRGSAHPLAGCVRAFFRTVRELSPRIFIMENVVPLARDPALHEELKELGTAGYRVSVFRVKYSDYGAAISRRRLFIVGVAGALSFEPADVLARMGRERAKTVREAILDLQFKGWDPSAQHIWPRAGTVERYTGFYARGKYGWYILEWDRPSPSFGNVAKTYILHPGARDGGPRRPISVREAMRIMGFPDSFTFPPEVSLKRKYEMVAEVVPPDFSIRLASVIRNLLDGERYA